VEWSMERTGFCSAVKDVRLHASLANVWKQTESLLRYVAPGHPEYTSHGSDHAARVLDILSEILKVSNLDPQLSETECYILCAATMLHDIGMLTRVRMGDAYRHRVRTEHDISSYRYITGNWAELGLVEEHVDEVAEVARAHRGTEARELTDAGPCPSDPRLRMCGYLLEFADECHIGRDRVLKDYDRLGLSADAQQHFIGHSRIVGPEFSSETVSFTVRLATLAHEEAVRPKITKLEDVLNKLRPILGQYGVHCLNPKWDTHEDELLTYKVGKALLRCGSACVEDLHDTTGVSKGVLIPFLQIFGKAFPFCAETHGEENVYAWDCTEEAFEAARIAFMENPQDDSDPWTLLASELAHAVLTEDALGRILGDCPGNGDACRTVLKILRWSPSALMYMHRRGPARLDIFGQPDLTDTLVGLIEEDFHKYPELLLAPDLLDDVFEHLRHDEQWWQRWRVRQVREYHKRFDEDKILEQWLIPNEWERRAAPLDMDNGVELKLTFEMPRELWNNPMFYVAAAKRLGVPLDLLASRDIKMALTVDADSPDTEKRQDIAAVNFDPGVGLPEGPVVSIPGSFSRGECDDYAIVPDYKWCSELGRWSGPLALRLQVNSAKKTMQLLLRINMDMLSCREAVDMIDASRSGTLSLERSDGGREPAIDRPDFKFSVAQPLDAAVRKLAEIGNVLDRRIAFPFASLPQPLIDLLLELPVTTPREARNAMHAVERCFADSEKPTVSFPVLEVRNKDGQIVHRESHGWQFGTHLPHIRFPMESTKPGIDASQLLDQAYSNAEESMRVEMACRLSPRAAAEYVRENTVGEGDGAPLHHPAILLVDMKAHSAVEYRSRVVCTWEPCIDTQWYRLTVFRCVLEPLSDAERWLAEMHELEADKGERWCAHLAAKEAVRADSKNVSAAINLGWSYFRLDDISRAMDATSKVADGAEEPEGVIAAANMGLFYLVSASEKGQAPGEQSELWYAKARERLEELEPSGRERALEMVLADFETFGARIPVGAEAQFTRVLTS
jgi:hypothetical protein